MTPPLEELKLFIHGKSVDARSGATFESQNPYTGQPWARLADGGPEDVDEAVTSARTAFDGEWGAMSGFARAAIIRSCGDAIAANAERLARLEVNDSGKLLREMLGQLNALPQWYYYFAGLADKIEGRTIPPVNQNYFGYTRREPVGVVAAITPWNSPLLLLTFKLAPALAAGCTFVVKPSEHAPASTLAFAEVLHEAGLPAGVVNVVTGWSRASRRGPGQAPGVDKVAFTGSSATGREGRAGRRRRTSTASRWSWAASRRRSCSPTPTSTPPPTALIAGRVRRHRADLHGGFAADRPRGRARRAGRSRRPGERDQAGRPDRGRHRDGARRQPAAVREGARLPEGRRRPRAPRSPAAASPSAEHGGLFVKPTVVTNVTPDRHDRARRGVRSGAGRLHVPRRGRGARSWPTTPRTAWPGRCGRRTCTARTG